MRVCLMIEGQEDVGWESWRAIASVCERHAFEALFRSDHYLSVDDRRDRGSLDAWGTLCALAAVTTRLRLGTLVSPVTFRHPSVLARTVVTADHISGGRIELGIGAGWWEPEHAVSGFAFPPLAERMELLEEQLQILRGQWGEWTFAFQGRHYQLAEHDARPKPVQRPRPPLILGSRGGRRGARVAARWADEYNTYHATAEECRERYGVLRKACQAEGRDPQTLTRSLMTGCLIGSDRRELVERARRLNAWRGPASMGRDPGDLPESWVVGTVDEVVSALRELEGAGVQRVMLQHHLHDDLEAIALIGREVIPALA